MNTSIEEPAETSMEVAVKRSFLTKNKHAIIVKGPKGPTQFCCVECPVRCFDKEKLEVHLLTHFKEYRYLCGICGTGLKRKEHLDRHIQEHQEVRPHVCPECGKGFKRKEHLAIHRTIHGGDKNQSCSLCNKAFYRKDHLQKHQQTHSKLFMEQNMHLLGDQEVIEFKQEVDDDDEDDYITIEENELMDSSTDRQVPQTPADTKSERPYACDLCEKTYKRKDHLKLHTRTHLKKEKLCSTCGKGFQKEEQLLMHMNTHLKAHSVNADTSDIEYNKFVDLDGGEFGTDSLLVPREMAQDAARPHECPVCHRKFKRRQHLKVHSNVHAKQSPNIWCSLCNEGFLCNREFESHECMYSPQEGGEYDEEQPNVPQEAKKENKHPFECVQTDIDPDMEQSTTELFEIDGAAVLTPRRVYVCKYCDKPFKRKDHYKIHLHVHTGVKSLFCPECGKGFYRKDHLQKHAQVHARAKPKPKKQLPALYPIRTGLPKKQVKPEITIHAPSNTKLRVPLQIKVPYQVVMSMENGEQRAVTYDAQEEAQVLS